MVQEVFPKFCKVVIIEFPGRTMSERVSLFVQRAMLLALMLLLQDQTQRSVKNAQKLFYSLILKKDIGKDGKKTFCYFIGKKQKVIGSNCYRGKKGKH